MQSAHADDHFRPNITTMIDAIAKPLKLKADFIRGKII